jgi:molecular chaperone DnaK (HSP70)
LVEDLLDRSLEPCKKALADAGITVSKIDEVVLVGGQTRMPKIQELVKKLFGRKSRIAASIPMKWLPSARRCRRACWPATSRIFCCST